jgi:hypothetical protein
MRTFLWAVAISVLTFASQGRAQEAGDRAAIEGLIGNQFAAFAEGDGVEAFSYASPLIQGMFGTPENFARMVRGGYPMIWAAKDVTFIDLREDGGRLMMRLSVRGPDGGRFFFDYEMIEIDGQWRINGVWPVKGDDLSA